MNKINAKQNLNVSQTNFALNWYLLQLMREIRRQFYQNWIKMIFSDVYTYRNDIFNLHILVNEQFGTGKGRYFES